MNDTSFDALLQRAVPNACFEECCEIEEKMLKDGEHVFSKEFEDNMNSAFKRKKKNAESKGISKRGKRPKFRYLLVAVLLLVLGSVTVVAYEPAREKLITFMMSIHEEYILIEIEENDKKESEDKSLEREPVEYLIPSYVPESYELIDEYFDGDAEYLSLAWENAARYSLSYDQISLQHGNMYISSDGDIPLAIKIGEYDGKLIEQENGLKTIFYEHEGFLYAVSGTMEESELMKMILSLEER